jgi:hypothetical protein
MDPEPDLDAIARDLAEVESELERLGDGYVDDEPPRPESTPRS